MEKSRQIDAVDGCLDGLKVPTFILSSKVQENRQL